MKASTMLIFNDKDGSSHLVFPKILVEGRYYVQSLPVLANAVIHKGNAPYVKEVDLAKDGHSRLFCASGISPTSNTDALLLQVRTQPGDYYDSLSWDVKTPEKIERIDTSLHMMQPGCRVIFTRKRRKNGGIRDEPVSLFFDGKTLATALGFFAHEPGLPPSAGALTAIQELAAFRAMFVQEQSQWQPETLWHASRRLVELAGRATTERRILAEWLALAVLAAQALATIGSRRECEKLCRTSLECIHRTPHLDVIADVGEQRRVIRNLITQVSSQA